MSYLQDRIFISLRRIPYLKELPPRWTASTLRKLFYRERKRKVDGYHVVVRRTVLGMQRKKIRADVLAKINGCWGSDFRMTGGMKRSAGFNKWFCPRKQPIREQLGVNHMGNELIGLLGRVVTVFTKAEDRGRRSRSKEGKLVPCCMCWESPPYTQTLSSPIKFITQWVLSSRWSMSCVLSIRYVRVA